MNIAEKNTTCSRLCSALFTISVRNRDNATSEQSTTKEREKERIGDNWQEEAVTREEEERKSTAHARR
jgi:hypothetical protein